MNFSMNSLMRQAEKDPVGTIYRKPGEFWGKTVFGLRPLHGATVQEARASLEEMHELGWVAPSRRRGMCTEFEEAF